MRKLRMGLFLALAAFGASVVGCNMPGQIHFSKKDGKWEAHTVIINTNDVNGSVIQKAEDRLNGK